jgi:nucleoside-specific outer membrane channel protein Tsx
MTLRQLLRVSIALALLGSASAARAGGFSTTNVQLLQGYTYNDNWFGHPKDKTSTTVTLNTFSTWEYGDSFAFADLQRYDSRGANGFDGKASTAYLEWHPRLCVNQLLGQKEPILGVVRNWGLAGEVNLGRNFFAYLGGLGLDLQIPGFQVAGLNLFYRYDEYAGNTWQISPYWTVPFSVGPVPFVFTGFVDINGTKTAGLPGTTAGEGQKKVEVWAQPELLVDVLGAFGGPKGKLHAGVEWYYHLGYAFNEDKSTTTSAPQAMVQWTVF